MKEALKELVTLLAATTVYTDLLKAHGEGVEGTQ